MTSLTIDPNLESHIADAEKTFRIVFTIDTRFDNPCFVPTWMYSIRDYDVQQLDANSYSKLDDWLFVRNWIRTQQEFPKSSGLIWDFISETRHVDVTQSNVYHVTKTESVESILAFGLEPGTIERCNTPRRDTQSNIYFARTLGATGEPNAKLNGTAHWWKEHFTNDDSVPGNEWTILSVDVEFIIGTIVHDPWSSTGLIYRAIDAIPPTAIKIAG